MTIGFRIALLASVLPAAAVAQVAPPGAVPPPSSAPPAAPYGGDRMASMTLAQFQARQAERAMAADSDGDGRISLAEWTAQANARMDGRRGGGGGEGGGRGGFDPAAMFARMDLNHDGFLDRSEIDAASAERFRRMDANGDGVVTPDERMAARGGGEHRHGHGGMGDGAPQP